MTSLTQDDVYALEQLRQRLQQLYTSLSSLQNNVAQSNPLPPWSSLQSQLSIVSNNLQGVSKQLAQHESLYASAVAFPLPSFPGRTQEIVLQQLLRTRLEPAVDDWIEKGHTVAEKSAASGNSTAASKQVRSLWEWAPIAASEEAHIQRWGADYTLAEVESGVEHVVTGLRRKLVVPQDTDSNDDDDDDEDEDDDEDNAIEDEEDDDIVMTGEGFATDTKDLGTATSEDQASQRVPPMSLDIIFRAMMTGTLPPGVQPN